MDDHDIARLFKVRTVTFFKHFETLPQSQGTWRTFVISALSKLESIRDVIEQSGIDVQMVRLATNIMEILMASGSLQDIIQKAVELEKVAVDCGLPVLNLGTIRNVKFIRQTNGLSELMKHLRTSFLSVYWDDASYGMGEALALSREIIAMERNEPGTNFRFGILFRCMGGTPYFPAAFADEGHSTGAIALGIENSHLLQYCYEQAEEESQRIDPVQQDGTCPMKILESIIKRVFSSALKPLEETVIAAAGEQGVQHIGIDTSIAPDLGGPNHNMEKCLTMIASNGLPRTTHRPWMAGSAATVDAITRAIKSVDVQKCGYCGVMLPVLENDSLAAAGEREDLTIQKLLLYSNMCGVGLDVLPVPGTGEEAEHRMAALLLDIAAISRRQNKPLSVRLLPVFNSSPGDKTSFDFNPYIINGAVFDM